MRVTPTEVRPTLLFFRLSIMPYHVPYLKTERLIIISLDPRQYWTALPQIFYPSNTLPAYR